MRGRPSSPTRPSGVASPKGGGPGRGRRSRCPPDLAAAGLYGVVVFLLTLGLLVVFVETVPPRRLLALLLGSALAAVVLAGLGEVGVALLVLGIGAALVANLTFEWLTTRP